jgi:hypothetical protein
MEDTVILSTAYFPPAEYFSLLIHSRKVMIEKWENYHKQTYRNRCLILGANGPLTLIVPVIRGSFHKTALKDLKIDNSRRWRDIHLRSIVSAYANAPYFDYYYDIIEGIISTPFRYLIDLNDRALKAISHTIGITADISYTADFHPALYDKCDYRYLIAPKQPAAIENYSDQSYIQVFRERFKFVPRLSIIDMLLNNGPGTGALLLGSLSSQK